MPTARRFLAAGLINNGIVLAVGGAQGGNDLRTVEAYNYATNTWTTRRSMPTAREGLAIGVINRKLYAVGGSAAGRVLNVVEAYDQQTNRWITKAPMPTAREGLAVGIINDRNNNVFLCAVGGDDANGHFLRTVEVYNPLTDIWTAKASMPTARSALAVGVVNGILYAIGGQNGAGVLNTNEAYNPATNTWIAEPSMLTASSGLAAIGVNEGFDGKLLAFGGDDGNGRFLSKVQVYQPAIITWTTKANMPTARTGLAVAASRGNNAFFAIGGYNGVDLNTVESLGL